MRRSEETRDVDIIHLWNEINKGKADALDKLYDLYANNLFNYGRQISVDRELIKDCIQELFVAIWNKRNKCHVPENPKAYMLKILKYKILTQNSKEKQINRFAINNKHPDIEPSCEFKIIEDQTEEDQKKLLRTSINSLNERQREAIMLKYYENLDNDEIAELLQINKQSVYNLIYTALVALKKSIYTEKNMAFFLIAPCIEFFLKFFLI
jgi:RNA polymerase sigma factor (sigma-70 family)